MNERFDPEIRGRSYKSKTQYRQVQACYPSQFYFCDLVCWTNPDRSVSEAIGDVNKGYIYVLVVVDAYSRYVWMRNLKTKQFEDVKKAFESIFKENVYNIAGSIEEVTLPNKPLNTPKNIISDRGSEFVSSAMMNYYKEKGINHISLQGESKAMLAERVIQDYRMYLRNRMVNKVWYIWTKPFVKFYNNKYHSVIKDTPRNVFIEGHRASTKKQKLTKKDKTLQYNIGDIVKIKTKKTKLTKKSLQNNWSLEDYKVADIDTRYYPIMYILEKMNGVRMPHKYYHFELLKID